MLSHVNKLETLLQCTKRGVILFKSTSENLILQRNRGLQLPAALKGYLHCACSYNIYKHAGIASWMKLNVEPTCQNRYTIDKLIAIKPTWHQKLSDNASQKIHVQRDPDFNDQTLSEYSMDLNKKNMWHKR